MLFLLHLVSKMRPPGRRQPLWNRAERLAAVHRRRGVGGKRNPPLRAGKRSRGSHHRPADRYVLQHPHLDLCLDRVEPQARASQGQGAAHRRYYKIGALVAFSGEVNDPESGPDPFTENSRDLNPFLKGRDIAEAFKGPHYQLLLVANKFQTRFGQPLLCGMYVDRRLAGICKCSRF
jgi:hypothetical protein